MHTKLFAVSLFAPLAIAVLGGCAAQTSGDATVTGSVAGVTLVPQTAVFDGMTGEVIFTTSSDPCGDLDKGVLRKGSTTLAIETASRNTTSSIIDEANMSTGTFAIGAHLRQLDDRCTDAVGAGDGNGTLQIDSIHLTEFSAIKSISGSFDVAFGDEHMAGSFTAYHCVIATVPNVTICK